MCKHMQAFALQTLQDWRKCPFNPLGGAAARALTHLCVIKAASENSAALCARDAGEVVTGRPCVYPDRQTENSVFQAKYLLKINSPLNLCKTQLLLWHRVVSC